MVTVPSAASFVAVGECMLELSHQGTGWSLGHGGDVFNTALYLARLDEDVAFMTALGDDPFSAGMRAEWQAEGLRLDLALTAPGRLPGMYAVQIDDAGERSFHYWREQAPVRDLFKMSGCEEAVERAVHSDIFYLSGITLALFDPEGRAALDDIASRIRAAGGSVVFDPNYRATLWPSPRHAQEAIEAFAPLVTHVLATFDDEAALYGDLNPAITHARWRRAGVKEIVIKLGSGGCMIEDGQIVPPVQPLVPIDTTGAGDAFNAGYLAARQRRASIPDAAAFANLLGGAAIAHRGAIMPRSAMPDLGRFVAATAVAAP